MFTVFKVKSNRVKAKFQLEMRMEIKKVLKLISHAQMKMRANTYLAAQNL